MGRKAPSRVQIVEIHFCVDRHYSRVLARVHGTLNRTAVTCHWKFSSLLVGTKMESGSAVTLRPRPAVERRKSRWDICNACETTSSPRVLYRFMAGGGNLGEYAFEKLRAKAR